jgi:hypothetical protein
MRDLLKSAAWRATEDEHSAAAKRLDELLDALPDRPAMSIYYDVRRELDRTVDKRIDATERAEEAREQWMKDAERDLEERWGAESRLATRGLASLSYSDQRPIETALDEEKERALTLLARRMKSMETGALTEQLVDQLVAKGLERVAHLLEKVR